MLVCSHTTLDIPAGEIHEIGLREGARIRAEMEGLSRDLFPGRTLEEVLEALRCDPAQGFATRDEVEAKARSAVERAQAALPRAFSLLPQAPCIVKRLEEHVERDAPMAYYRGPAADGSRPGTYYVNTHLPEKRLRAIAEALAFHEAVPGHHLQISIAQELRGIPEIQKHSGATSYIEGWALYAERLADEMGLYSGDLDRLGMLSFDAWRSARLVVDTGIHALGWDRDRAIAYMLANTISSRPDIENEVDRYIVWPGQALSYKLGQLEVFRLRRLAEERLGARFDLREFHRRLLENGAVPLPVLRDGIQAWVGEGSRAS